MVFRAPSIAVQQANAKIIFDYFADPDRFGPVGAIAMVAMAAAESAFSVEALGDYVGGIPHAFGLWQPHDNRCEIMEKGQLNPATGKQIYPGCGINIRDLVLAGDRDVLKQCAAVWHELCHSEHHARLAISLAKTPREAAVAATTFYERPGAPGQPEKRAVIAETWAAYFGVKAA